MSLRSLMPFSRSSLLPSDGNELFGSLQREVNRTFDQFWRGLDALPTEWKNWGISPQVDVKENTDSYEIVAELPGVDPKDINLEISDNMLVLKGEKKGDKEDKNRKGYHLQERFYGSFTRSFVLPSDVQVDKIASNFDKGILTIQLPKNASASSKVKKIEVKTK